VSLTSTQANRSCKQWYSNFTEIHIHGCREVCTTIHVVCAYCVHEMTWRP